MAWRGAAYALVLAFTIAWTLALGKDVHWDAVNYHLYLGFSALHDRFDLDFFGAGTPSYLNPYAYLPLYLMTAAGIPALGIAVALAALHGLILWLTYEIAVVAGLRDARLALPQFAVLGVVLAVMNPVLLQGIGSTAIDVSTGVLVVGGWLLLARALRTGSFVATAAAGCLCGVAAALKLSNAAYALAAIPALAFIAGSLERRARAIVAYGSACAIGFVAFAWPWSAQLWREFGNPFFPFFNHWFGSPDFTDAPLRYERFLPASWRDFVLRPFDMLSAHGSVHTEPRAPDLRYAVLLAALALWGALGARRWTVRAHGKTTDAGRFVALDRTGVDPIADRVLYGLLAGLTTAWVLWLALSGNSRYFVPMACIASAVLALVLQRIYRRWRNGTIFAILIVLAMQFVQLALGTDLWRAGQAWDGPWLRVAVPDRFRDESHLHLSVAYLSGSAFAPHLHDRSGFINITGFNALGPARPGGARAQALIDRNADRVRLLIPLPNGFRPGDPLPGSAEGLTFHVRRFGLRVDPSDCDYLGLDGNLRGTIRQGPESLRNPTTYFLTCRLLRAPELAAAYAQEVREVDAIFDRVESACPRLFHPPRPVTEELPSWMRLYNMGSEIQLWIEAGRVKYFSPFVGGEPIDIGSAADWAQRSLPIDCSRKSGKAFGGLLG